jgi:hypothetical protein
MLAGHSEEQIAVVVVEQGADENPGKPDKEKLVG